MECINKFRKRNGAGGVNNTKDKTILEAKRNFERSLKYDPSSQVLRVTDVDEVNITNNTKQIPVIVNDYSDNDQKAFDEKWLLCRIGDNVDIGCYVEFDNCFWLIVFREHKSVRTHQKFIMKKCNQIVKYRFNGIIYEIPTVVKNLVQYSDGMQDIVYTSIPDAKRSVSFGVNYITKNIDLGQRLMINKKGVYKVTHLDDFQYNASYINHDGIASAIVVHTAISVKDDLENNVADNDDSIDIEQLYIDGSDNVIPSGKFKYKLSQSKYTDWEIEYIGNNKNYITLSRSGDDCILEVRKDMDLIGNEFKLISLNNANIMQAEKLIKVKGF